MKKQLRSFLLAFSLILAATGFSQPAWTPELCLVTVDSATASYISVLWNKPVATDIDSFYIYRADSTTGAFQKIAAVDYADSSAYDDIAVNVNTTWYTYMISAIDHSGIEGPQSNPANTCLLDVVPFMGSGYFTCMWNPYTNNFNPGQNFRCMWDSLGGTAMTQIGGLMPMAWSSWNHTGFSLHTSSMYRLEVDLSGSCSPSRAIINTSRSNLKNVANPTMLIQTPEHAAGLARVFPNPCNGIFNLEWNAALGVSKIEVRDVAGRLVHAFTPAENQLKKALDLTGSADGIYFVNFYSGKGVVSKRITAVR